MSKEAFPLRRKFPVVILEQIESLHAATHSLTPSSFDSCPGLASVTHPQGSTLCSVRVPGAWKTMPKSAAACIRFDFVFIK